MPASLILRNRIVGDQEETAMASLLHGLIILLGHICQGLPCQSWSDESAFPCEVTICIDHHA